MGPVRGRRSPSPERRPRSPSPRKQSEPSPENGLSAAELRAAAERKQNGAAAAPAEQKSHSLGSFKWETKKDKPRR